MNVKMDKDDVSIEQIEDAVCDHGGDNCTFTPTHRVVVDFRSAGQKESLIGDLCETCATEIANRIRESLPEPSDEN